MTKTLLATEHTKSALVVAPPKTEAHYTKHSVSDFNIRVLEHLSEELDGKRYILLPVVVCDSAETVLLHIVYTTGSKETFSTGYLFS